MIEKTLLEKLSNSELAKLESDIKILKEERLDESVRQIANKAEATGHEYLVALAHAMRHSLLGIEPPGERQPSKRLGYRLASLYLKYYEGMGELSFNDIKAIRRKIQEVFVVENYILDTTNYDELDNGYFFRRS